MAYVDLITDETATNRYLIVMLPRRRLQGFSLVSGAVYSVPFSLGDVVSAKARGVALSAGTSSALSAGEYFHDVDAGLVYVRLSDDSSPNITWLVVEYEIHVATASAHWYRVPTDDTTRTVFFDEFVIQEPKIQQTMAEIASGYAPTQSSTMNLNNAEHWIEEHLSLSSFNGASILVYHWLGDLDVANIQLVMSGYMGKVSYSDDNCQISIVDRVDALTDEWRHEEGSSFVNLDDFPEADPQGVGKTIRRVFGIVDGFSPINVDYLAQDPTTSDNRVWLCVNGQSGLGEVVHTVPASPVSTTTRTYLTSTVGINVGDTLFLDGVTDYYVVVTAVDRSIVPFIEHDAIGAPLATGEAARRGFISRVTIVQDSVAYLAMYGRDYTVSTAMAGGCSGFTFSTSLEANLSMPKTLQATDRVIVRVYGPVNALTLDGPAFGGDDTRCGNMAAPAQMVLYTLKTILGFTDDDINAASFQQALLDSTAAIAMVIPSSASGKFPKTKDIILDVLKSALMRLSIASDGTWKLNALKPMGASVDAIDKTELIQNTFTVDYDYGDTASDVTVNYDAREASETADGINGGSRSVTVTSEAGTYLHEAKSTFSTDASLFYDEDASQLAARLSFLMGEPDMRVKFTAPTRFFVREISDEMLITREALPGFSFSLGVANTTENIILQVERSIDSTKLTLTDQKGVEDNAADW